MTAAWSTVLRMGTVLLPGARTKLVKVEIPNGIDGVEDVAGRRLFSVTLPCEKSEGGIFKYT